MLGAVMLEADRASAATVECRPNIHKFSSAFISCTQFILLLSPCSIPVSWSSLAAMSCPYGCFALGRTLRNATVVKKSVTSASLQPRRQISSAGATQAAVSTSGKKISAKKPSSVLSDADEAGLEYLYNVKPGDMYRSRLSEHYNTTLSHDLMYSLYNHVHHTETRPNPSERIRMWSPDNPYSKNRKPPKSLGKVALTPNPAYTSSDSVPTLEYVVLHSMSKKAVVDKLDLIPMLMMFQSLTGEALQTKYPGPYGPGSGHGIELIRSTEKMASFKVRKGAPIGFKVVLRGEPMYNFLESLTDFVLPRWKTFNGFPLPPASASHHRNVAVSGVVSFGFPPEVMGLFPQIEANLDQYPNAYGFHVNCVTSARGKGAQDQARALLSGMNIPFVKGAKRSEQFV